jgi:hypothetical protein
MAKFRDCSKSPLGRTRNTVPETLSTTPCPIHGARQRARDTVHDTSRQHENLVSLELLGSLRRFAEAFVHMAEQGVQEVVDHAA